MTTFSTDEGYLTLQEAARDLRLHDETVRRYLRSGELEGDYVGRRWRIYPSKLKAFKDRQKELHHEKQSS